MNMTDACYRLAVEQRIRELFADRHRLSLRYQEDRAELRALLRIARRAQQQAHRFDPITEAKAYAWTDPKG